MSSAARALRRGARAWPRAGAIVGVLLGAFACEPHRVSTPPLHGSQTAPLDADHTELARVLAAVVRPDGVDYRALRADHAALDSYRGQLARTMLPADPAERMALYINAYNAWTLALVIDLLPADEGRWARWSIKSGGSAVKSVWKSYDFELAGERVTLDQLEHERLRPMGDPRIHFAINCASRSCPALAAEPYHGSKLDTQLDSATRRFVDDPAQLRLDGDRLLVNPILDWFGGDFAKAGGVRAFLVERVSAGPIREHLRGDGRIEFFDYDWSLNVASSRSH